MLDDISVCMSKIQSYINGDYIEFVKDTKTQDAVVRNIEIIGEAVKKLSEKTKVSYPDVPWKTIAATRDRLIHGYFGVNIDIVWEIATIDLVNLRKKIEKIKIEVSNRQAET